MKSLSRAKRVSIAALSLLLLAFVMGPAGPVLKFTASIDPDEAIAGVPEDFEILITNIGSGSGGSATIGSAAILIPAGFTVIGSPTAVTEDLETWTATVEGGYIKVAKVGATSLDPGESVTVSFSATASAPGEYEWTTSAYHGADWTTPCTIDGDQPTVTVIALDFYFAGWRPPVINHLDDENWDGWESGSTMPVKFLVEDGAGNPVTSGVEAYVAIGTVTEDNPRVLAVWDPDYPDYPNQWKAEVKLVGSGPQDVTITGNVTDVESLSILVKENPEP